MKDGADHGRTTAEPRRSDAGAARDAERRDRLARAMRENLRRRKSRAGLPKAAPSPAPPTGASTT